MNAKFSTLTLWIFAAIGAAAPLVVVVQYLRPQSADLMATIYPNKFSMPIVVDTVLSEGYRDNGRSFLKTLDEDCKKRLTEKESS